MTTALPHPARKTEIPAMQLANYLFFTTQCGDALAFYERCGLGKATILLRYGLDGAPVPTEALRGRIMHARFEGPGVLFYASDNHDAEPMRGSAHFLTMESREATDRLFGSLCEGGRITTPLGVQSWGDYFGKVTDRFGVQWMLNFPMRSQAQ
jgi:PhnB protein